MRLRQPVVDAARSLNSRILDGGIALALTGWALAEPGALHEPARAIVLVAMPVVLAWRRQVPVAVLAVEVAGIVALPDGLDLPQTVVVLIAAYSAAFYSDKRLELAALLIAASAWALAFGGTVRIPNGLVPLVLVAPVWLGGTAMRRRVERAEASAARADRLEREREDALRVERARIARELHDLVTHSVSVMVLQTGAAREIMGQDEHRSRGLLESVESSGRSALEELRHMLGLLADEDPDTPLAPQPGVNEIPALIEQVREAGISVMLSVEGPPRPVAGGAAVAVYRIVQEALTNVIKHADGAPAEVVLRWSRGALELEIIDQGPPHAGAKHHVTPGRGLTGMRERAAMYGGTLDAQPGAQHGYVVRARIPLDSGRA